MARIKSRYGKHRGQVGDLWRPDRAISKLPVVVLIHGGYWKALGTKMLMNRLAAAVTAQGWAAWNIEYRRVGLLGGGGGWPATFADAATAIDHLAEIDGVDLGRVVTCGHSAGGHLAMWAAGRGRLPEHSPGHPVAVSVRAAVSLAGVVDLERAAALGLGHGATLKLLGGSPQRYPERYLAGSPAALLPLGVPQVLVHGLADTTVPPSMSQEYQRSAAAAGDEAVYVPLIGFGHMDLIDPTTAAWPVIAEHLGRLFS